MIEIRDGNVAKLTEVKNLLFWLYQIIKLDYSAIYKFKIIIKYKINDIKILW